MDDKEKIGGLIVGYLEQRLTNAEQTELDQWLISSHANRGFFAQITNDQYLQQAISNQYYIEHSEKAAWANVTAAIHSSGNYPVVHRVHFLRREWFRYAAAIIFLIGIGAYLYYFNAPATNHTIVATASDVPAPDALRATIRLSNGKTIALDSLGKGLLATEGSVEITRLSDGRIIYNGSGTGEAVYNTITVPRGSKIASLTLSDGTIVYLNTASSLRYPVTFAGGERRVQVTGEVYFEVAKDRSKKFIVENGDVSVEVLGTHFNVNMYTDENAKAVTLLEGSIKVNKGTKAVIVKPGQQAVVDNKQIEINISPDINHVMAWKNGLFAFKDADIPTVMKQLGKWYNVEVVYENGVPDVLFSGEMQRKLSLSQTIEVLNAMNVHCAIRGKQLIIRQ